jgi:hypothetical protein
MRYLKSTIAGILALLLFGAVLLTILFVVARVEGDIRIAFVPGWHSARFWVTTTLAVGAIFIAGFFWEFRKLAKTT